MKITNSVSLSDIQVNESSVSGVAAIFNTPGRLEYDYENRPFRRVIRNGAIKLASVVKGYIEHQVGDARYLVCGTHNNSATLTFTDSGINFSANIIDTTDGLNLLKQLKAGLVTGISFGGKPSPGSISIADKGEEYHLVFSDIIMDEFSFVDEPVFSDCRVMNSKDSDISKLVMAEQERIANNKRILESSIGAFRKLNNF
jgi:phage head maturation protease